ncbi:MAG: glycoside hydrolase family 15, partial [Thermoplasmata archaeon]|nr:glycoside hydrolase family 15 [Candidatus Sysuiplasma superficiale]
RHTHSAVMSWMAIDRAAVIAKMTGRIECWQKWRNISRMMRKQILERSYDDGKGYFSGLLDDDWLDASVLVLPDTGFIDARSTEFRKTLQTIGRRLMDNGLLRRYEGDDGIEGDEGAFVLCTFWYIEALFLSGHKKAALRLFELTMQRANHLGLFSEEIDPQGGGFLGNFPQAFSHLGMIKTACVLQSKRLMNQKPKVNGLEAAH